MITSSQVDVHLLHSLPLPSSTLLLCFTNLLSGTIVPEWPPISPPDIRCYCLMVRREEAKARGASPDRAFLPGGGDMMGGDESFEAAKAR